MTQDARETIESAGEALCEPGAGGESRDSVTADPGIGEGGPAAACRWILAIESPASSRVAMTGRGASPQRPSNPQDQLAVANDRAGDDWDEDWLDEPCPFEMLASNLPALEQALGSWFFEQLVDDYLTSHGEDNPAEDSLVAGFVDYLALSRPDHDLPAEQREPWGDFLVELATFESSWRDVSEAAEATTPEPSRPTWHRAADPCAVFRGAWDGVGARRMSVPISYALHRFAFPVDTYWRAVRRGETPDEPEHRSTELMIEIRQGQARVRRLGRATFLALRVLARGGTLEEAREAAAVRVPTFRSLLGRWIERGWVTSDPRPATLRRIVG